MLGPTRARRGVTTRPDPRARRAGGGSGGQGPWADSILPTIPDKQCTIDLQQWGIYNDGTHPVETTDGINQAIEAAVNEGCGRVILPTGTYLVGKKGYDHYTSGIVLQSNMALVMDEQTTIQLTPTDTWAYCIVAVTGKKNVGIYGGSIVGDRDEHNFVTEGEEGHCVCIENESEFVEVNGVTIRDPIGDGILIVGQGEAGSSCKHITVRNSEIARGRRQGISIVGGTNVLIENNEIHHIEGTAPQFGIDIESLSYKSADIIIRNNDFHHNAGGDVVNCDGRDVLVENNTTFDGDGNQYSDGAIVYWKNVNMTIRGNHITMLQGSWGNGRLGIIGYSHDGERTNPKGNFVEGNTCVGCGMYMYKDSNLSVTNNVVQRSFLIFSEIDGLVLQDNAVEDVDPNWAYLFTDVTGRASGNTLNGEPVEFPLSDDEPFTNYTE